MNLDKDTYEYLTNFADDRTILNMLAVNKKFNDHEFFRRVLERKYPTLLEFKKTDETYKHLFLRMIKVLAILLEKYKIPYIPTKGCDPEMLLEIAKIGISKLGYNVYEEAMFCAAAGNNLKIVKYLFPIVFAGPSYPYSSAVERAYNHFAFRNNSYDVMKFLEDVYFKDI